MTTSNHTKILLKATTSEVCSAEPKGSRWKKPKGSARYAKKLGNFFNTILFIKPF